MTLAVRDLATVEAHAGVDFLPLRARVRGVATFVGGYHLGMWLLGLLIVIAIVVCSMPLPETPRHRAPRLDRDQARTRR